MRILVLGELCNDVFCYGNAGVRINPEAPTPLFVPSRETSNPGMAGNFAANLKSLRPQWEIEHVFQPEKITKKRLVDEASSYILIRIDEGDKASRINRDQLNCLLDQEWDCIAISSYNKGFLTQDDMELVFSRANCPTFADHKFRLGEWSKKCFCVKINKKEFEQQPEDAPDYCQNLVVTLGKDGAALYEKGNLSFMDKRPSVAIRSLAGAGDSYLAGLVVNFLETEDLRSAVKFANLVGTIAVTKPGVVTVKEEDLYLL